MVARFPPIRESLSGKAAVLSGLMLLAACDGPTTAGKDGAGQPGLDSLDAELGKDKLNHYDFSQGSIIATGQVLDLAIEGGGFFILKNHGRNVYFRRPASFSQDAQGYLNLGNGETRLQGIPLSSESVPYPRVEADSFPGAEGGTSGLVDIAWALNDMAPPRATAVVKLARNLDPDAGAKGSVLYSRPFLHHAGYKDVVTALTNARGDGLGIREGDVLTLSAMAGAAVLSAKIPVTAGFTLGNLADSITAFLRSDAVGAGAGTTADWIAASESPELRGALTLYGNTGRIRDFQVGSKRPVSGPMVLKAFAVPADIAPGATRMAVATETLRRPAVAADPLSECYDALGFSLGLEGDDPISISGSIGGDPAHNVPPMNFVSGPRGTTVGDILKLLEKSFDLPDRDGTFANAPSVSVDEAGSDDNIPDGALVLRGRPGAAWAIRDVATRAGDDNNAAPSPNFFNTNMDMTAFREATDDEMAESSIDVFDASGKPHLLTIRFTPTVMPGEWIWEAGMGGGETLRGGRGKLSFGSDGSVAAFMNEAKDTRLEFDPGNGLKPVNLALSAGVPGDFSGLTQFRGATTAAFVEQDGFPAGKLQRIGISEDGIIRGSYANGRTRALFQIPLAEFPSPKSLELIGENSFLETAASGKPVVTYGLGAGNALIHSGAIESLMEAR